LENIASELGSIEKMPPRLAVYGDYGTMEKEALPDELLQ
jgi:hypothetical protein